MAVAACAKPPPVRDDLPDSAFSSRANEDLECFASVAEAATPPIGRLRANSRGERGTFEVRVSRRDEQTYVIDTQEWDSGHDDRGYFHARQILEFRGDAWCQTRILYRTVRVDRY
jgi:hypothetical protein